MADQSIEVQGFLEGGSFTDIKRGEDAQLSDCLKPATVLNYLLIRCQKRSLLIISLFFNDKVTLTSFRSEASILGSPLG